MTDRFQVPRGLKTLFVAVSAATLLLAAGCQRQEQKQARNMVPKTETIRMLPDSALTLSRTDLATAKPLSRRSLHQVMGNVRVVLFGEWHEQNAQRDALAQSADALASAGIRQLVLGDLDRKWQPELDEFNKGGKIPIALIAEISTYEHLSSQTPASDLAFMAAMHKAGIRLFAGGYSYRRYKEENPEGDLKTYAPLADTAIARTVRSCVKNGKTAVLAGGAHMSGAKLLLEKIGLGSIVVRLSCANEPLSHFEEDNQSGLQDGKKRRLYEAYDKAFGEDGGIVLWPLPRHLHADFPFDAVIYNPRAETPESAYQDLIREVWPR